MRPALIVSRLLPGPRDGLFWAMMITSAARADWPGDVAIEAFVEAGLPAPSKVRTAKMTTITPLRTDIAGRVDASVLAAVRRAIARNLAWPEPRL